MNTKQVLDRRTRIYTVAPDCYEALVELMGVLHLQIRLDSPLWKSALGKAQAVIAEVEKEGCEDE